jgi:malonate transporter
MVEIFAVTSPFFLLVFAGYIATRFGLMPIAAISGLNTYVLYFALPCMLFNFGAKTPIHELINAPMALLYLLCAAIIVGVGLIWNRKHQLDWNNSAFSALIATFPNTGFMGVPLLVALLGQAAAGPVIITIFVDLVIVSSVCIAISRIQPGESGAFAAAIKKSMRGVISNPMPWAICLGAFASASQLQLPSVATRTIELLGNSASPVALFTIGAVLARSALLARSGEAVLAAIPVNVFAFIKLVIHPVLIFAMFYLANHWGKTLGIGFDPFEILVISLVGALPSASNVTILAERFQADAGQIAKIVLVSTAAAFVTFPLTVAALKTILQL